MTKIVIRRQQDTQTDGDQPDQRRLPHPAPHTGKGRPHRQKRQITEPRPGQDVDEGDHAHDAERQPAQEPLSPPQHPTSPIGHLIPYLERSHKPGNTPVDRLGRERVDRCLGVEMDTATTQLQRVDGRSSEPDQVGGGAMFVSPVSDSAPDATVRAV
ncbi:MAG TPA: hypothetical protein VE198_06710 [Actinoallomurus sp.]|nr:hypothetical protein [Actinoallomurus sp.]